MTDKAEELIENAATEAAEYIWHIYRASEPLCGSPIEKLFLAALIARRNYHCGYLPMQFYLKSFEFPRDPVAPFPCIDVIQQAEIGPYKADFLFDDHQVPDRRKLIVVELDGHDYHDRTKAQASHDRKRDRFMVASGFKVLRFTGSDVYRDPIAVVDEVVDHLSYGRHDLP